MNIALINGSPKKNESASSFLLCDLKGLFPAEHSVKELSFNTPFISENDVKELSGCPVWVFAFPLYVDGIPSHLLSCLKQIEGVGFGGKSIHVYSVVNCGFYEGVQNRIALKILNNWCIKAGFIWGMGIGLGGGGALASMKGVPLGRGPKSTLGKVLGELKACILTETSRDNIFISVSIPRFLYKLAAEMGLRHMIKSNGVKRKDLGRSM